MELEGEDAPSCGSGDLQRSAANWVNLSLRMLSLDLVASDGRQNTHLSSRAAQVEVRAKDRLKYQSGEGRPTRAIARCLLLVYLIIKFSIIISCKFTFDSRQNNKRPKANGGHAALEQDQFDEHRRILERLGDPHISLPGCSIIFYIFNIACVLFIYFFAACLVSRQQSVRFDCLASLLEPKEHLGEVRADLDNIHGNFLAALGSFERDVKLSSGHRYVWAASHARRIMNPNLVARQANLGAKWQRRVAYLMGYLFKCYLIMTVLVMMTAIVGCLLLELFLRAQQRAQQFELGPRLVELGQPISLARLDLNHQELYKRRQADNLAHLLYLGLAVESRYFLQWAQLWTLVELVVISLHCTIYFSFFLFLMALASMDKLVWLNQVNRQLEASICSLSGDTPNEDEAFKLAAASYLNHLLFLARFPRFRRSLDDFILLPAMLVSLGLLAGGYAVAAHNSSTIGLLNRLVFYGIGLFVLFPNFFLLWPALITARLGRQAKLISTLLARIRADTGHLGLAFIRLKWSRQLLSDKMLALLLAPTVFGIQVTGHMLIAMNSYLVALLLFLYSLNKSS